MRLRFGSGTRITCGDDSKQDRNAIYQQRLKRQMKYCKIWNQLDYNNMTINGYVFSMLSQPIMLLRRALLVCVNRLLMSCIGGFGVCIFVSLINAIKLFISCK